MNEKMRILNLLKDGTITVEEAETLLNALSPQPAVQNEEAVVLKDTRGRKPKKLRVTVDAGENGPSRAKVNVNLPISLLKALGPFVKKSLPNDVRTQLDEQGIDLDAILSSVETLVDSGLDEDIVNIDAGENGESAKVRVYVE